MADTDREKLEREVAALICEHVTIGYSFAKNGGGLVDPETIFVMAEGAAHVIVHRLIGRP
jgi:hypothetical protein